MVLPWQVFSSILPARAVNTSLCLYEHFVSQAILVPWRKFNAYPFADILLAIATPDRWLDNPVVGDSHVQVGNCKQGKADSEKVQDILDKEPAVCQRNSSLSFPFRIEFARASTYPYASTNAPSALACLSVLYPTSVT